LTLMIALAVESVTKRYRVRPHGVGTLLDTAIRRLHAQPYAAQDVWALRDVGFEVEQGRALGIIGHNGAGKSTLLRLLCGISLPTRGRVTRSGPVSGLLELGGGFHPDCTGRQNLMTAGLLTGLTAAEVRARHDEIVAFAELEDVIDRVVRTYSSGMYLRLAFAAVVHFDPAILVIDEVLAVGDTRFQQKCLTRIKAFRQAGKTLVLASHVPEQIKILCDDVLVLDEGRLVMRASPPDALRCYDDLMLQRTERRARALRGQRADAPAQTADGVRHGTQEGAIEAVRLHDLAGRAVSTIAPGEGLNVELDLRLPAAGVDFALGVGVYSEAGEKCFEILLESGAATFGPVAERATVGCVLPALPLLPARYTVIVGLYPPGCDHIWDYHWQMHKVLVVGERPPGKVSGVLDLHPRWHMGGEVPDPPGSRAGGS
jgi:lipopolysaccharide transport system ATP-binding protein